MKLRLAVSTTNVELTTKFRHSTFQQLQTLLTNYPSVRQLVQVKPGFSAKNLMSLFTSLDNLTGSWGDRYALRILYPAKVSRTLPKVMSS